MTAHIANGGFKIKPRIIDDGSISYEQVRFKINEYLLNPDLKFSKEALEDKSVDFLQPMYRNQENIKFVQDAMFVSTNEPRGTSFGSRIDNKKYQFAGKTGTAQVKRITESEREADLKTSEIPYLDRDHALYIAFGPYKDPRYSLSILIEHGGSGSSTAAPLAKKLFKKVIDRHEIREQTRLSRGKLI